MVASRRRRDATAQQVSSSREKFPASIAESVYQTEDARYLSAVQVNPYRCVRLGDVVAIQHDEGKAKFDLPKFRYAQVLVIIENKRGQNWSLTVRWLPLHNQCQIPKHLHEEWISNHRRNQLLLEMDYVQEHVDLQSLLPQAVVEVRPTGDMTDGTTVESKDLSTHDSTLYQQIHVHIPKRLDTDNANSGAQILVNVDDDWVENREATLLRGWKHLPSPSTPQLLLKKLETIWTPHQPSWPPAFDEGTPSESKEKLDDDTKASHRVLKRAPPKRQPPPQSSKRRKQGTAPKRSQPARKQPKRGKSSLVISQPAQKQPKRGKSSLVTKKAQPTKKQRPVAARKSSKRQSISTATTEESDSDSDENDSSDKEVDSVNPVDDSWLIVNPKTGLRAPTISPSSPRPLLQNPTRSYWPSCRVPLWPSRCGPRLRGTKRALAPHFDVAVGDVVCIGMQIHDEARSGAEVLPVLPSTSGQAKANPWHPFAGPWKLAQILCIYKEVEHNQDQLAWQCEVRWCTPAEHMPAPVQAWMPRFENGSIGNGRPKKLNGTQPVSIYTTDVVTTVPATFILGPTRLWVGPTAATMSAPQVPIAGVPTVSCRCVALHQHHNSSDARSFTQRFVPIFSAAPRRARRRLMERGLVFSKLLQEEPALKSVLEHCFDINLASGSHHSSDSQQPKTSETSAASRLFDQLLLGLVDDAITASPSPDASLEHPVYTNDRRRFFASARMIPRWESYAQSELLCGLDDRRLRSTQQTHLYWNVWVGDFVAISLSENDNGSTGAAEGMPFVGAWRVGQVVALYQDGGESIDTPSKPKAQVKWMQHDRRSCSIAITTSPESVCETSTEPLVEVSLADLLAPAAVFPAVQSRAKSKMDDAIDVDLAQKIQCSVPPFLPLVQFTYTGVESGSSLAGHPTVLFRSALQRSLDKSMLYNENQGKLMLEALEEYESGDDNDSSGYGTPLYAKLETNLPGADEDSSNTDESYSMGSGLLDSKIHSTVQPFAIDKSTNTEFFSEIMVGSLAENFAISGGQAAPRSLLYWKVKMGDVVILRYAKRMSAGRTAFGGGAGIDNTAPFFPFNGPWAVAEVVTIWSSPSDGSEEDEPPPSNPSNIRIEIRWLYRSMEVLGGKGGYAGVECEEVYESDHCEQDMCASHLVAPSMLHASPISVSKPIFEKNGIPVTEFFCRRLWSVGRRCLVPSNGLEGRLQRSRMHSKFSSHILGLSSKSAITPRKVPTTWKEAFESVIEKLSLTDASKEANESCAALIGREHEKKVVRSFLEAAVTGRGKDSKPSIFLAGPPGVGKTACVRAIVHELKMKAHDGRFPDFDFVTLNGMEMRYPFEAYVKLWEELGGDKGKTSPEKAARKLEEYFVHGQDIEDKRGSSGRKRTTVVLLDEIDYLKTEKQTVLYNFFDWPSRAVENESNHPLVVLGVSNTLNLPEHLHPRVQSRMGSRSCIFKSYNESETTAILKAKVKQASPVYQVFDEDAIIFASKKTAALSGDIRRAFHICRAAAESFLTNHSLSSSSKSATPASPIVKIQDVSRVSRESFNSSQYRAIRLCTSLEVLLLVAIASLSKTTGRETGGFDVEEIVTKMEGMVHALGDVQYSPPPSLYECLTMLNRLQEARLVALVSPQQSSVSFRASLAGSGGAWPLVSMPLDEIAILLALRSHPDHKGLVQKYLVTAKF